MLVKELIEQLKTVDENLVVLRDDNNGIEAIHGIRLEECAELNTNKETFAVIIGDKF